VSSAALTAVVTLAAIAAAHAAGAAIVSRGAGPFARATAPMIAALAVGIGIGERIGALLPIAAAMGAGLLAIWLARVVRMLVASRRLTRAWGRSSTPLDDGRWGMPALRIDTGAPVVAVAGLLRPRLFIDRSVLDLCTAGELDAIAAHERAHVRRRDNVRRLLVGACAGPHSAAAADWRASAEHLADRSAAASPRSAVDLAAALVKLARAGRSPARHDAILSTVHDGGSLESRVRHLLALDARAATSGHGATPMWLSLACLLGLPAAPPLLRSVHHALELLVQRLP
jgi:hypothetical protein